MIIITPLLRTPALHLPQFSDVLRAKPIPCGVLAIRIDLSHAFYSVPLHPASRFLTTFRVSGSRSRFTRLPIGLSTSPSFLQPLRASAFLVWAHIDDIILVDYPHCFSSRVTHLIEILRAWNFIINGRKSQLAPLAVINYLGLTLDFRQRDYATFLRPFPVCSITLLFSFVFILSNSIIIIL